MNPCVFLTCCLAAAAAGLSPTYVTLKAPGDERARRSLAGHVPAILRLEDPTVTGPLRPDEQFVPTTFVVYHSPATKATAAYDENFLSSEPYYRAEYGQFCDGAPNVGVPRTDGTWRGLAADTRQEINGTAEGTLAFGALGTSRHLFCAAWCRNPRSVGECSASSPRSRARMVARCQCPRDLSRASSVSRWLAIAHLQELHVLKGDPEVKVFGWSLRAPFAAEIRGSDPREPGTVSFFGIVPAELVGQRVRWYLGRDIPHVNVSGWAVFEAPSAEAPSAEAPSAEALPDVPVPEALSGRYRYEERSDAWVSRTQASEDGEPEIAADPSPSYFWCQHGTHRWVEVTWFFAGALHGILACCALYGVHRGCERRARSPAVSRGPPPDPIVVIKPPAGRVRRTQMGQIIKALNPDESDENDFFSDSSDA